MILRTLRWLSSLDRSYFFAISAFISGVVISAALIFAPVVQTADGGDISLLERDGALILILLALPLFVLATPLVSLPQNPAPILRSHKVNGAAATFILFAFVFISLPSFGLFYVPALVFSIASTVSLYFGRKPKLPATDAKGRPVDEDGIRLSRSALRRQREQERIESEGGEASPPETSPLKSSRRRRGRKRRR